MNSVGPTNSSLGGAPGRAFFRFKACILFKEPGKYRNTFSETLHCAVEELETHRAQVEEREKVSKRGSLWEKPTALQSGSALTESHCYLFICIPLFPLEILKISVCRSQGLWAWRGVGTGGRSPPRCGGSRSKPAVGWVSLACAPVRERWHKEVLWGRIERGHRCPTRPQGFCSCCCQRATPRAHWALASTGERTAQWSGHVGK